MSARRGRTAVPTWTLILATALAIAAVALAGYVLVRHLPATAAGRPAASKPAATATATSKPSATPDPTAFVYTVRAIAPDARTLDSDPDPATDAQILEAGWRVCDWPVKTHRARVAAVSFQFAVSVSDDEAEQILRAADDYLCVRP